MRQRWRTASLAAGWPFPSDWVIPQVDDVCSAVVLGVDVPETLTELGNARAEAGCGLAETLTDLAALHAVLGNKSGLVGVDPNAVPADLMRATALGWADALTAQVACREATDALTGLASGAYLLTRLGEVYRTDPTPDLAIVAVTADLSKAMGWSRMVTMVLVADVLRTVFAGGQTLAVAGPTVAVALTENHPDLVTKSHVLRWMISDRMAVDPQISGVGPVRTQVIPLPATQDEAASLVTRLGKRR
ncbi:hypothetical protein D5S17_32455 [Pseudonocardiaceae bacterium YIM PH 21723]|nr:hypothetical protein D5S17_32455 [Pseudonocardiaceae bacterium YIM PH 21723]